MNKIVEIVLVGCLIVVLLANSSSLTRFSESLFGKFVLISLIILATLHNHISGLIAVLIFICISNNLREGNTGNMRGNSEEHAKTNEDEDENEDHKDEKNSETDSVKLFRSKNCKEGKLVDKDGNPVSSDDIASMYPNLNFDSERCNPCDDTCHFSVSTTSDQLGLSEMMKPLDSTQIPVDPNQSAENAKATATSTSKEGFFSF